jgi:signal transduction histidine kinase
MGPHESLTSSASPLSGRGLVWVVDDSPVEIEMAQRLISPRHEVKTFTNGSTALEQLASGEKPDVLVLDWHMPDLSGLEICRFLRGSYDEATLPILILTATGGPGDLLEGLAAGANDFVTKAFDPPELVARVSALVRAKKVHDRLKHTELITRKARETAEEANRAKDVFLATVSHELRTPLNAILGWARLLGEKTLDPATLRRGLETIERNAKIQVQLIEDILDTTRVVTGKFQLELGSLDLSKVVRAALDSVKPSADLKHVSIEVLLGPGPFYMQGDADRLQQTVWNLLTNAIKFTPPGGQICVELRRSESKVELCVTDSGKGIAESFLPHVFDRFRQEDQAVTRRYSGLGLGLALVKHIVTAHDGAVSAFSDGEGRGAAFTITLPFVEESPRSRAGDSDHPSASTTLHERPVGRLAGLNVLVVEDDEDARDLFVTVLGQQGALVRSAATAAEALTLLALALPDVLVSDIGLPEADGYELVRAVRALGHLPERLPAIALTAYAHREDRRLALEAGFQAHVAKPVDPDLLVAAVAAAAARGRPPK